MESGLYALGILSIVYYFIILWYTKRWNSTFSWFWIAFGALNVVLGFIASKTPDFVDYLIVGVGAVCGFAVIAAMILILCAMVVLVPKNLDCIMILGAQIRGKKVSESLKRRLDRGLRYLQENPGTFCIVSGGQGKGEDISEAEAMAEYLMACGIEKERIYLENESKNTYENFEKSMAFLERKKKEKVGVVTNNFHIYRSMKIAKYLGYRKIYAIPASCNPVMFLNYMVREIFALIMMYVRVLKN